MLNDRIIDLPEGEIRDLLDELGQVKGLTVQHHQEMTLQSFLDLCQRDVIRDKKDTIKAGSFYRGSLLRTKVGKFSTGQITQLVQELCDLYRVHRGLVLSKTLYVFLNQIWNVKSQLRKPPPIRFCEIAPG